MPPAEAPTTTSCPPRSDCCPLDCSDTASLLVPWGHKHSRDRHLGRPAQAPSALPGVRSRAGSAETLLTAEQETLEGALSEALRTLKETVELSRRTANGAAERGQPALAKRFEERALEAEQWSNVIRRVLTDCPPPVPEG
jgi:hypothetical protein